MQGGEEMEVYRGNEVRRAGSLSEKGRTNLTYYLYFTSLGQYCLGARCDTEGGTPGYQSGIQPCEDVPPCTDRRES